MSNRALLLGRWLLVAAVMACCATLLASYFNVRESIIEFLPTTADRQLEQVFRGFADSEQARQMVLTLGAAEATTARRAANELANILRRDPEVAFAESGPDSEWGEEVYRLYFPRRLLFLSPKPEVELPQRLTNEGLRAAALDLKERLNGPLAAIARATAAADPLGSFSQFVDRLRVLRPDEIAVIDGSFMTADHRWAVVMVRTKSSPFNTAAQTPFLARMQDAFAAINDQHGSALVLERSGINRFASAAAHSVRHDIIRISGLSTAGIIIVFAVLFRSVLALCAALVPLLFGLLAATAVGIAAPNGLHVLTLAFGATLLGVCIDYPIHYLTHRALLVGDEAPGSARAVWSGLLIGALTTVVGFACLGLSPYPGIRELAVFAVTGVVIAFLMTRYLIPLLLPGPLRARAALRGGAVLTRRLLDRVARHPRIALAGPLTAFGISLAVPFIVSWGDDVARLNTRFPQLEAEQDAVQQRVSEMETGRFVVSLGPDDEAALRVAEMVDDVLLQAQSDGLLEKYRGVSGLLWSTQLQARNLEAVRAIDRLSERLDEVFAAEGFRPQAFAEFERALGESPTPLTYEELAKTGLGRAAQNHRIVVGDSIGFVTYLQGITDSEALQRVIEPIAGARYIDQQAFLRDAYAKYRVQAVELFALGIVIVTLIIALRYRRIGLVFAACGPALLGVGVSLAVLGAWLDELHLLHVLASVLVFSMGVDYGVFLLEARHRRPNLTAATLSIILAASFTLLSFGLLAISANGALRAIGLTIAIGVPTSLALAILMFGALAVNRAVTDTPPTRRRRYPVLERAWIVWMTISLTGCARTTEHVGAWLSDPIFACELQSPAAFPGSFLWRQTVRLQHGEHQVSFETAVQKRGGTLVIVGLAPAAGTLFALALNENELTYESKLAQQLPFPPCMIVADFQRSFFPLHRDADGARLDGADVATFAGERVVEVWHQGRIRQREFRRSDISEDRGVVVDYRRWDAGSGLPTDVVIRNRRVGYTISIETTAREDVP